MPLYEYECTTCHRRTEKIMKFSDPELTVCPHCGGKLERTLTAPAVHFAGGGWYKDGYASAKPPAASGAEGSAAPAASGDSAKPAASTGGDSAGSSSPAPSAPLPPQPPRRRNPAAKHVSFAPGSSGPFALRGVLLSPARPAPEVVIVLLPSGLSAAL